MTKKKILLIDFDLEFIKLLSKTLTDEGYEVITASDGLSGFEKFSEVHPNLVIMEAMLPKFHGFELCSRITSHPTKKSPVIIITGIYKDAVYKTEALRSLGASAYFEKPVNLQELLAKIYELAGKPEVRKPAVAPEEDLDKLLKDALSLNLERKEPAEKSRPAEKPARKPEPIKPQAKPKEDEVDLILKSKLKDLISETSVTPPPFNQPAAPKPEKEKGIPKPAEPKKEAIPPTPPPASDTLKKALADVASVSPSSKTPSVRPEPKPEVQKDTQAEIQTAKTVTTPISAPVEEKSRPASVAVSSPFKGYLKEEEEETEPKKKGAGKFIGLAAGILVVAAAIAFFTMKKKETPYFSPQANNQVAALQTSTTEPPKNQPSEEELAREIEKQMDAYRSQKAQASSSNAPAKNPSQANQPQRSEPAPAAAPLIPKREAPIASLSGSQTPASAQAQAGTEEPTSISTQAAAEEKGKSAENQNQTEEPRVIIPVDQIKTGDLVPLNTVDVEPRIVKTVEPIYPEADRRMGIKGQVLLNVLISETGDVLEVVVIRGIRGSLSLEKEAVNAVKKWKFLPAEKNGVKVKVWKPITIGFGLNK